LVKERLVLHLVEDGIDMVQMGRS